MKQVTRQVILHPIPIQNETVHLENTGHINTFLQLHSVPVVSANLTFPGGAEHLAST